jgi:hypothetical protein
MPPIVNRKVPQKSNKVSKIFMDSDAVFHEESEYLIGFKI